MYSTIPNRSYKFAVILIFFFMTSCLFASEIFVTQDGTLFSIGNANQKIEVSKQEGKKELQVLHFVKKGASWTSLFEVAQPLISGGIYDLSVDEVRVVSDDKTNKSILLSGQQNDIPHHFLIGVSTQSNAISISFKRQLPRDIISPERDGKYETLKIVPTIAFWSKRNEFPVEVIQGPAGYFKHAPAYNTQMPAAYVWDKGVEAAIYFDRDSMQWLSSQGVYGGYCFRVGLVQRDGLRGFGLYPVAGYGATINKGEQCVSYKIYAAANSSKPTTKDDGLARLVSAICENMPSQGIAPRPANLAPGELNWTHFAQKTMLEMHRKEKAYSFYKDTKSNPFESRSDLQGKIELPKEFMIHPDFLLDNHDQYRVTTHQGNFATFSHHLAPRLLIEERDLVVDYKKLTQAQVGSILRFFDPKTKHLKAFPYSQVSPMEMLFINFSGFKNVIEVLDAAAASNSPELKNYARIINQDFLQGLDHLRQYAQNVDYRFAVYYNAQTLENMVFYDDQSLGKLLSPVGASFYAYLMLRGYEINQDPVLLQEAERAMAQLFYGDINPAPGKERLSICDMPCFDTVCLSYGIVAAQKLFLLTKKTRYKRAKTALLANLFQYLYWYDDLQDPVSAKIGLRGLTAPAVANTTPTPWESTETIRVLLWLLKNDSDSTFTYLIFKIVNLYRLHSFNFFPASFSADIRALSPHSGRAVGQYLPYETLRTLENGTGSTGVYSAAMGTPVGKVVPAGEGLQGHSVYMAGTSLWNYYLFESLAKSSHPDVLLVNLDAVDHFQDSLQKGGRHLGVFNPSADKLDTVITIPDLPKHKHQLLIKNHRGKIIRSISLSGETVKLPLVLNAGEIFFIELGADL